MCIRDRDDTSGITITEMKAKIRRVNQDPTRPNVGLIVIDYLQLMTTGPVSYTHLDVYKRQILCRASCSSACAHRSGFRAGEPSAFFQPRRFQPLAQPLSLIHI